MNTNGNCPPINCVLSSWWPRSCQRSSKVTFWRTWCSWLSWRTLSSSCTRSRLRAPARALPTTCSMIWNKPWPLASTPSISPLPRALSSEPAQDLIRFGLLCDFGFIAGSFGVFAWFLGWMFVSTYDIHWCVPRACRSVFNFRGKRAISQDILCVMRTLNQHPDMFLLGKKKKKSPDVSPLKMSSSLCFRSRTLQTVNEARTMNLV